MFGNKVVGRSVVGNACATFVSAGFRIITRWKAVISILKPDTIIALMA